MLKVKIKDPSKDDSDPQTSISLQIRRNLNGDYMIFDHSDIYITVVPSKSKVVTVGKPDAQNTDVVYDAQNRLFQYLEKTGAIDPATVEGGALYSTIEASYYESEGAPNSTQVVVFLIGKFIEEERPYFIFRQAQEELETERLADPDDEYSTELGEVPHGSQKGTIHPNDFPSGANYRVYQEHVQQDIKQMFKKLKGKK